MAQSITITKTFNNDAYAQKVLDFFCYRHKYASRKQPDETKEQFLQRLTVDWWISEAAQGKSKQNFMKTIEEFKEG